MGYRSRERRSGFTLIELLIVITIIAILVALSTGGVMALLSRANAMTARGDMNAIGTAIGGFRTQFPGVKYVPSRIILREDTLSYNTADALESRSSIYLQNMFGQRLGQYVNWSGRAGFGAPYQVFDLAGEECLTFFLGGIPTQSGPNACLGFSTDDADPSAAGGTRRGPFMDFKSARLIREPSNGFFKYQDPYSAPGAPAFYVYLSSGPGGNAYSLDSRQGVEPYYQSVPAGRFMNADSFQIICAGRNGKFGPGGAAWSVTEGYGPGQDGSDDIANFSASELLIGQK